MSPYMRDRRRRIPVQPNPFGDSALGSPWSDAPVDVPAINEGPFRGVMLALAQMRQGARGTSIVLTGEPGSGKTHLLSRVRLAMGADATYLYVRCNASAATLWRHVRASVASDLLKREAGGVSRLQVVIREHPERFDTLTSVNLHRVLVKYGEGRQVLAASAWLRGEALGQADLDALGTGAERDDEERSRESEARDAVNGLLAFLAPDPVVLCFDQVEALETYRGDRDGFHAMGTLVAELYHEHHHLLMVSCVVSAFEHVFEELTNKANYDRWLQNKATLKPIDQEQAAQLIRARLDSSPQLAAQRSAHEEEPLWPLDAGELQPLFEATGVCLPRKLIQACKVQFESLFGDVAVPRPGLSRSDFLQQEFAQALGEARTVVARQGADKTLGESLPWLLQRHGFTPVAARDRTARFAQAGFRNTRGESVVSICYGRGNELTSRLRKIERFWTTNPPGLKVICNPTVTPGAVGQQLLRVLQDRGAQVVHPLPEAIAALQAIHDMIAAARSGDLAQDGEGIGEAELNEWLLGNMPPQLEKLREDLVGRATADPDPVLPKLAALLGERKVVDAAAAAEELGSTLEEVSACARRNPMRFGVLAGPPLVLFEAVEAGGRASTRA
jgi:hypothetical protein